MSRTKSTPKPTVSDESLAPKRFRDLEKAPMCFHAVNQPLVDRLWQELKEVEAERASAVKERTPPYDLPHRISSMLDDLVDAAKLAEERDNAHAATGGRRDYDRMHEARQALAETRERVEQLLLDMCRAYGE